MHAEPNGQFDWKRNFMGVSHSLSETQNLSHWVVGFGVEGFPCLIHSPSEQIQVSSPEKVFIPTSTIINVTATIKMIFKSFFIL